MAADPGAIITVVAEAVRLVTKMVTSCLRCPPPPNPCPTATGVEKEDEWEEDRGVVDDWGVGGVCLANACLAAAILL